MTDNGSLKNRITDDLEKVKQTGKTRLDRVRVIAREAFSQSLTEVKGGSHEVRAIAQETVAAAWQSWKQNGSTLPTQPTVDVTATSTAEAIPQPQPVPVRPWLNNAKTFLSTHLPKDYNDLKQRILHLDAKLTGRYGDRYLKAKQRLRSASDWYKATLAQTATTTDVPLVERKQAEFNQTIEVAGTSVAQKEHQIKQQLKQFLRTATSKQ